MSATMSVGQSGIVLIASQILFASACVFTVPEVQLAVPLIRRSLHSEILCGLNRVCAYLSKSHVVLLLMWPSARHVSPAIPRVDRDERVQRACHQINSASGHHR
jgi:hypothetical protein